MEYNLTYEQAVKLPKGTLLKKQRNNVEYEIVNENGINRLIDRCRNKIDYTLTLIFESDMFKIINKEGK